VNTVILAISQKWQDEELIRATLRKLHDSAPHGTLRFPDPASGAAKDAREFADALGFKIEKWTVDTRWQKYPTEIRNQAMLSGVVMVPIRCEECGGGPHSERVGPPADLLMAFWCSTSDNVKDIIDRRITRENPTVIYREKWQRKKGQEPIFKGVERAEVTPRPHDPSAPWKPPALNWKPVLQEVRAAA